MTEHSSGGPSSIDREIDVRSITRIAIWLGVVTVLSFVISWGFYLLLERGEKALDAPPSPLVEAAAPQVPPGPQLQASPAIALQAFRAEEEARLASYGWVDRTQGVAHVPVERAIDRVAAEGSLPSFAPPATPEPAP